MDGDIRGLQVGDLDGFVEQRPDVQRCRDGRGGDFELLRPGLPVDRNAADIDFKRKPAPREIPSNDEALRLELVHQNLSGRQIQSRIDDDKIADLDNRQDQNNANE